MFVEIANEEVVSRAASSCDLQGPFAAPGVVHAEPDVPQ